ncbi:MAG TPA: hypothetical protein VMM56_03755 [Planctomycetaceae bacterium]|nr:hypothetical protein [Planctomycetaceae bacterium]
MRKLFAGLAFMGLTGLIGCEQGTPGGTGTTGEQPMYGQADDTFNLSVPLTSSSIQQGEAAEAKIGIKRAKNFDQDVTLEFADLPKGVTVDPASPKLKSSETDAKVTFKVDDEAALGDFKVKVTGHPTEGADAQIEYKLTIVAKDSFTLSMPKATPLKQGETQTVTIGIKRDKSFDQDVALSFGDLPEGVTLDPSDPVIKHGESGAQVEVAVAEDASLGDFTIQVIGHPTEGVEATDEIKLTVVEK